MHTPILIQAPSFDFYVLIGMVILGISVPILSVLRFAVRPVRALMFIGAWLGFTAYMGGHSLLLRTDRLPPVIFWLTLIPTIFLCLQQVKSDLKMRDILWMQSFRLPLELLMWRAALQAIMPLEFSLQGYNLDVLTGISALCLALMWPRLNFQTQHRFARYWNAWGIFCLIVIAALVVLSSPQIHAFGAQPEQLNTWVLFTPYIWLPTLLVPTAIWGHWMMFRVLRT